MRNLLIILFALISLVGSSQQEEMINTFARSDTSGIIIRNASGDSIAIYVDANGVFNIDGRIGLNKSNISIVNSSTYDLVSTDNILHVSYTVTGAVTSLTLPTAQTLSGRVIVIKDAGGAAGTNSITIDTEGAQTIDGSATAIISVNYNSISLYCDGTNWFIY